MTDLARLLGELLALDVRTYPDGPPAAVSAIPRPRTSRTTPERKVYGRLHADECTTLVRMVTP